jgi:acetyl-CoA carboxylase biotin carboxyl carrier protein
MELEDIRSLIGVAERLGVAELEARKGGVTLRLVRAGRPDAAEPTQGFVRAEPGRGVAPEFVRADLVAPLSGVLHLSPAPDAPPFVTPGQQVKRGDTLCIIEAMKVFSRVSAERDGVVEAVLFETGAEIEAGQIVMRIA